MSKATPAQIAKAFQKAMLEANTNGQEKGDGIEVVIKDMQVEIKGIVEITDGETQVSLPDPDQETNPAELSTIHFTFASVPTISST